MSKPTIMQTVAALDTLRQVIRSYPKCTTVADCYDTPEIADAIATLMPDFEYPDISHLTIEQFICRTARR